MIGMDYLVGNCSKIVRSTENVWDGLFSGKLLKKSPQHWKWLGWTIQWEIAQKKSAVLKMFGMDYSVGNCSNIGGSTENDWHGLFSWKLFKKSPQHWKCLGWTFQWEIAQKRSAALKMIGMDFSVGNCSKIVRSTENVWDGLFSGKLLKHNLQHWKWFGWTIKWEIAQT